MGTVEVVALVLAALLCVAGVLWLAGVGVAAWLEVQNAPRTDMFECERHGMIPVKSVLSIPVDDGGPPVTKCPLCFEDAMKMARTRVQGK